MVEVPNSEENIQAQSRLVNSILDYSCHGIKVNQNLVPDKIRNSTQKMAEMYTLLYKKLVDMTKPTSLPCLDRILDSKLPIEKILTSTGRSKHITGLV